MPRHCLSSTKVQSKLNVKINRTLCISILEFSLKYCIQYIQILKLADINFQILMMEHLEGLQIGSPSYFQSLAPVIPVSISNGKTNKEN